MKHLRDQIRHQAIQRGFTLMEVLIGIVIFAIGMLALASLQGALTRSTAEAKVRTTAVDIAEQIIEGQRGFAQVLGGGFSFDSIADSTTTFDGAMNRNPADGDAVGVIYTVTQDVTDYYYDLASDKFKEDIPTGAISPDYKTVVVNVAWNDNRDFVIDENTQAGDLGGGFVEVSATISKVSVVTALQVSEQDDSDIIAPDIIYTPGANPDIVSLGLGDNKFKESLAPEPKVYRDNLETRFDVITYSTGNALGALFLRREEFVAVGCECSLRAADAGNQGKSPAVWAGDEYTEPESLTKAYGDEGGGASISQSSLCGTCCRDHHDGGGGALYDPSRPVDEYSGGNHKHYYTQGGQYRVATDGQDYLEACRFVRKDGFFRLTQDFRLEGLNTFAGDYLITTDQVADYSAYVIGEVYVKDDLDTYVPAAIDIGDGYQLHADHPTLDTAPRTAQGDTPVTGDLTLGYTTLPTTVGTDYQQLRGRSIYIDNMSSDLRDTIECIEGKTEAELLLADPDVCDHGDVVLDQTGSFNILELLPFFEIQTTYLNDWQKKSGLHYFSLTNETITTSDANGPTHSRGKVENQSDPGADMVKAIAYRGVTGLTASDPISAIKYLLPTPASGWKPGTIEVDTGLAAPLPDGKIVRMTLSSEVPGLKASNVGFIATNDACNFVSSSGVFTCFIPAGTTSTPTLTITNFDKPPKEVRLCSNHQFGSPAELPVNNPNSPGSPKVLDLTYAQGSPVTPYLLWLTEDACPSA